MIGQCEIQSKEKWHFLCNYVGVCIKIGSLCRNMVGGMDIEQGGLTAEQGEKSQSGYSFMQVVFLYFLLLFCLLVFVLCLFFF